MGTGDKLGICWSELLSVPLFLAGTAGRLVSCRQVLFALAVPIILFLRDRVRMVQFLVPVTFERSGLSSLLRAGNLFSRSASSLALFWDLVIR